MNLENALEATYQAAWADVPSFWQDLLTAERQPPAQS